MSNLLNAGTSNTSIGTKNSNASPIQELPKRILSSEAQDYFNLELLLKDQITEIRSNVYKINNRSTLFDNIIRVTINFINRIEKTLQQAHYFVLISERYTGTQRSIKLENANGRYEAIIIELQVMHLVVNYLTVADIAETAGFPIDLEPILADLGKKVFFILNEVLDFNRLKIQAVSRKATRIINELNTSLEIWAKDIDAGAILSRKAISAANALTIVLSLYQAGRNIASSRGPPLQFQIPTIGSISGGAAVLGTTISIPPWIIESVRNLIKIGAISGAILSFGAGPSGYVPSSHQPTLLFRVTPSGRLVPSLGPYSARPVSYGDPRHKHTKVADYTLEELKLALRKPLNELAGILKKFCQAVKNKEKEFGGQLSKEATERYEELVRRALERGVQKRADKFYAKSEFEVGIDINTGRSTPYYRLDGAPNGAHIIPDELAAKYLAKTK